MQPGTTRWRFGAVMMAIPAVLAVLTVATAEEKASSKVVRVATIDGMIDLGLVPYVERTLRTAEEEGAAAVVLEVNTFGGRVDAAVAIRDLLLGSKVRTIAFVNQRAISAGALITLAADKIVVAKGATIGAATPVQMTASGESTPTDEKSVSYVRKEFRATADARGRPGAIAEAMVDKDVEIAGLVAKGKLLTLTTAEALRHGVADHQAEDLAGVLAVMDLRQATVRASTVNWAERVVRFLTHPVVSSLLISLAMLGLLVELRTPGFGIPGLVGLLCLAAFFWGHSLVRLVGWEEMLLVVSGMALLALEVFVIPGFGIAGVLGIVALLGGLTLSLLGDGATLRSVIEAVSRVAIAGGLAVIGLLVLMRFLPHVAAGRKLVLGTFLPRGGSVHEQETAPLLGRVGTALTTLRPAGIAEIDGRRVDVVSTGEYIAAGQPIEVIEEAGSRIVVRTSRPAPDKGEV
jgi:membrane-bound serine protease (ClpP class)